MPSFKYSQLGNVKIAGMRVYTVAFLFLAFTWIVAYWMMYRASKGHVPHVRHLAAFDSINEAIGRAAEMGKPVHFTTGHSGGGMYSSIAGEHMAGFSLLSYVARQCAEKDARLITTVSFSEMIQIAEDVISNAAIAVGRPDYFQKDMVRFASDNWLGYDMYAMSVIGEEQCAANIMIGAMDSTSSMIISAGGAVQGAIGIGGASGTGVSGPSSIAPFIVFCDYVLIGEETPAAGAIVSGDVDSLSGTVSSDYVKVISILAILAGTVMISLGINMGWFTV